MNYLLLLSIFFLTTRCQEIIYLEQQIVDRLDQLTPKCFDLDNINVLSIQEQSSLFSRKYEITLAALGRCSFFALGDSKVEWVDPINSAPTIWTYTLNFTKGECKPYGGQSINTAARNISNGVWLPESLNCAYYIVVGNKDRVSQKISITRTNAINLVMTLGALMIVSLTLIL